MSHKWTSVATEVVIAVCGAVFFWMAYNFDDGSGSLYASAGYYPMLISGLLTLFSIAGIIHDLFGKNRDNKKRIDISHIQNVGFVVLSVVIIVVLWQLLNLFYVGGFAGTGILLIALDTKKKTKKSVIKSLLIALGMCMAAYIIFEYALHIHV